MTFVGKKPENQRVMDQEHLEYVSQLFAKYDGTGNGKRNLHL